MGLSADKLVKTREIPHANYINRYKQALFSAYTAK